MTFYKFIHPVNNTTLLHVSPHESSSKSQITICNKINVQRIDKQGEWSWIFYSGNFSWVKTKYLHSNDSL